MRLLKPVLLVTFGLAVGGASAATAASFITGAQVRDGSLTGRDIQNGSVTRSDLAPSARGLNGARGSRGPQGQEGPEGAQGLQGDAGPQGDPTVVHVTTRGVGSRVYGEVVTAIALCPDDAPYAVSGGYEITSATEDGVPSAMVLDNEPGTVNDGTHRFWKVTARNESDTGGIGLRADAVCMNTPPF